MGYGFDIDCPGRETADAISTEIPVILDRVCGHTGAGNGLALSLAGFSDHPDGILRETGLEQMKRCSPGLDPAHIVERLHHLSVLSPVCISFRNIENPADWQ